MAVEMAEPRVDAADLRPVEGPQAWYGPEMARSTEWIHELAPDEVADLERAVADVRERGVAIVDMRRPDFDLPALGPALARMRDDVVRGRGFVLIRGVPVEKWDIDQAATAYWGIGLHLGSPVSQNAKGHALGHVKDLGYDYNNPLHRGYQTSARLPYHCDSSDVVGLLSWKTARAGGLSSIVSSVTLFNEMVRRRPDLAAVLTRPVYRDRRGEIPEGRDPWYAVPVFNPHEGNVITTYVRSAVRKAQRFDEVPRITPEQEEAMDLLDSLAEDPAIHLDMEFRRGDIQFLNNHYILHSRTAFEDYEEPEKRRHLLRLWLACADGPPLPEVFTRVFQDLTEEGRPNGILTPGVALNAPLEAA